MGFFEIDEHDIGFLSDLKRANPILEAQSDVLISGASGPDQPDEPDDVVSIPGRWAYAAQVHRAKPSGENISKFKTPIEEQISFETGMGEVRVTYRNVVRMKPGERKIVIFGFDGAVAYRIMNDDIGRISLLPEAKEIKMFKSGETASGVREDWYEFNISVKVEGLGLIGVCPLKVIVEEPT